MLHEFLLTFKSNSTCSCTQTVKFIYSEKATKFYDITLLFLTQLKKGNFAKQKLKIKNKMVLYTYSFLKNPMTKN